MRRPRIARFSAPGAIAILSILAISITACGAPDAPAALELPAVTPVVEPKPDPATTQTESSAAADTATRVFAIDPAASKASYLVDEEFLGQNLGFVKTIGATQAISGSIQLNIDGAALAIGENIFVVDLSTLTSDQPRRDNAIRRDWLQSSRYPLATFKATTVTDLPADAALGSEVAFNLVGDLTIRETTLPQTWAVRALLDGNTLTGTAQGFLYMRDFGFEPPDIAGMLKVTDGVTVTVDFTAIEQP